MATGKAVGGVAAALDGESDGEAMRTSWKRRGGSRPLPFWAAVRGTGVDGVEGALKEKGLTLDADKVAGAGGSSTEFDGWAIAKAVLGVGSATGSGGVGFGFGIGAGEAKAEPIGVGNEISAGVPVSLREGNEGCLLDARDEVRVERDSLASASRPEEARVEVSAAALPKPKALFEGEERQGELRRVGAVPAGVEPAFDARPLMMSMFDQPTAFAPTTRREVRR